MTIVCDCGDTTGQPDFDVDKYDYQANGEVYAVVRFRCSSCKKVAAQREVYFNAMPDGRVAIGTFTGNKVTYDYPEAKCGF